MKESGVVDIHNLNKLLPSEKADIRKILLDWQKARNDGEYKKADKFRSWFYWWDMEQGIDGNWYPIFEYSLNRQRRAFMRMRAFKVDIYPWTMSELSDSEKPHA